MEELFDDPCEPTPQKLDMAELYRQNMGPMIPDYNWGGEKQYWDGLGYLLKAFNNALQTEQWLLAKERMGKLLSSRPACASCANDLGPLGSLPGFGKGPILNGRMPLRRFASA